MCGGGYGGRGGDWYQDWGVLKDVMAKIWKRRLQILITQKKMMTIVVAEWQNNRVDGGGGDYGGRNDGW